MRWDGVGESVGDTDAAGGEVVHGNRDADGREVVHGDTDGDGRDVLDGIPDVEVARVGDTCGTEG
jgi:hypothetical protein